VANRYDRGQQLAGQTILSYEIVYQLQGLLRNIHCCGKHDNWRLRPKPSHFDCNLFPVHLGHEIVGDHDINRMDGSQFQSFAAAGGCQNLSQISKIGS
jgi:hypothetical protein